MREFLVALCESFEATRPTLRHQRTRHLDDPKAIAVLEKFTDATKESPERAAAARAVASLRDTKKPSVEFGKLRSEVLKLQRENRELRKDLDDLKKRLDTLAVQPDGGKRSKATAKAPKG